MITENELKMIIGKNVKKYRKEKGITQKELASLIGVTTPLLGALESKNISQGISNYTLYKIGKNGLAVIQQKYNPDTKTTWWNEIDPWLVNDIYLHPKFKEFFDKRSGECTDGLYPTVTVRQIMWALKMKPLKREGWETCFDRRLI